MNKLKEFFRINRPFIVNFDAIENMFTLTTAYSWSTQNYPKWRCAGYLRIILAVETVDN